MMEKKGWKTLAIIFIIISIGEFMILNWAWNVGGEAIERENECIINICYFDAITGESNEADSYGYDDETQMCYCYKDGETIKQQYMK